MGTGQSHLLDTVTFPGCPPDAPYLALALPCEYFALEIKVRGSRWDAGDPHFSDVFTFSVTVLDRSQLELFRTRQEDMRNWLLLAGFDSVENAF